MQAKQESPTPQETQTLRRLFPIHEIHPNGHDKSLVERAADTWGFDPVVTHREGEVYHIYTNGELVVPGNHVFVVFTPSPESDITPSRHHLNGEIDLLRGQALQEASRVSSQA